MSAETRPRKGVYRIYCKRCGRGFIWVGLETDKAPTYHSDRCRKTDRKRQKNSAILPCPRPEKRVYSSVEQAQYVANRFPSSRPDAEFYPYRCVCSALHLGHRFRELLKWTDE